MAQQGSESVERQIFDAANEARRAQGVARLKWDASLARAARQHAAVMARQDSLSHQFPGEPALSARAAHAGVYFISLSENVAQGPDAENVSDQWAKSPDHRQNLLDPDMNVIGIGVVERNGRAVRGRRLRENQADGPFALARPARRWPPTVRPDRTGKG